MRYKIGFGGREIGFTLEYCQRKTLGIRVHPDEQVQVLAHLQAGEEEIKEKVRKKARWILKQIDRFRTYLPATPLRRFVSGEPHLYIGQQYRLKIAAGQQNAIKAYRGQLWIITPDTKPAALKNGLISSTVPRLLLSFMNCWRRYCRGSKSTRSNALC